MLEVGTSFLIRIWLGNDWGILSLLWGPIQSRGQVRSTVQVRGPLFNFIVTYM